METGAMRQGETKNTVWYRVACGCGSRRCDLYMDFEYDRELNMCFLHFYKNMYWPGYWGADHWWEKLWLRVKGSLRLLVTGYMKVEEEMTFRDFEHVRGFIVALEEGCEKMREKQGDS